MERSIDELIELLNDKDDFVVEDAVGELELRADESLDPLIDALSSRKKQIRLHAATLLGAINDPKAIPALIETLHDNNKLVRREASTERAIPALEKLLDDESGYVKQGAQSAIASIKK
ncbi:HEAT repeat domain-containing protein [uncultured Methanobrevibacter sp.]|uniref:HEAT repeat domain-containing protein n=1 Tax=uncultured Methanobrevibacter sp. TaxID=253161 RepID=UPI0025F592AB|nr:HEAT repeat domain-containing protein [uncultured Methanobrevibacter sp.]